MFRSSPNRFILQTCFIILMLAAPPAAWSQSEFHVNCDNVVSMSIVELPADADKYYGPEGLCYMLKIDLTDEAYARYNEMRNQTPRTHWQVGEHSTDIRRIELVAGGRILTNDAPYIEPIFPGYTLLVRTLLQDALDDARTICPGKTPRAVKRPDDALEEASIVLPEAEK